jgi:predicted TIM-barrel fold metal-dependent hydrolase
MKTITLEEHFVTENFLRATGASSRPASQRMETLRGKLLDLGDGRIQAMDEAGISVQVLSLAAMGVDDLSASDQTAVLNDVHDELHAAIRAHPGRLAGFATPGLKYPAAAVKELERCISNLGFKGLFVDGTTDGRFLDAPEFFPLLEAAASLGVPLYLHPAPPPAAVRSAYYSGLPGEAGMMLSIAGWGWHAETGLHLLRLIVSGVLERLPALQVIVGHMGEGLPYALARSNNVLAPSITHLRRSVTETMLAQVHVTTSGCFTRPPFDCARQVLGLDRMLFSVDYPYSSTMDGRNFLTLLQSTEPALTEAEMANLSYGNAVRILRL